MNRRIQQLAEQAGFDLGNGQSYKVENFAELIVRECISSIPSTGHRGDFYRAVEFCQLEIKKHFGVEE
jgi:hypothetical protein